MAVLQSDFSKASRVAAFWWCHAISAKDLNVDPFNKGRASIVLVLREQDGGRRAGLQPRVRSKEGRGFSPGTLPSFSSVKGMVSKISPNTLIQKVMLQRKVGRLCRTIR